MMDVRVQGFCPRHSDVPINYTGYYDGRISPSHSETLWSAVRLTFAAALLTYAHTPMVYALGTVRTHTIWCMR